MRILLVCQKTDRTDGWATYTNTLQQVLLNEGHDVQICSESILGSPLACMSRPWTNLMHAKAITKMCKQWNPDVIHYTVEPYALSASFLPKKWKERTVLTVHGNYGVRLLNFWLSYWLAKRMYQSIQRFITVSSYTKNIVLALLEEKKLPSIQEKTHVVVNSVPLPEWNQKDGKKSEHSILFVGSIKGSKGIMEAVDACAEYAKRTKTPFKFSLAGKYDENDPYVQKVKNRIQEFGLEKNISLLGRVSDEELNNLYESAGLFMMLSHTTHDTFEGFGLVYLEANARGVPVIGPNTSGAAEAIADGESGYQVDVHDPNQVAAAMHRILDEKRISPMQCRAWAEKHSPDTQKEVIAIYQSI